MDSLRALILVILMVPTVSAINPDYQRDEVEGTSRPGNPIRYEGETVIGDSSSNMPHQEDSTPSTSTVAAEFAAAARETEQQKSVNRVSQGIGENEERSNRQRQHKGHRKNGNHHRAESGEIRATTNSTEDGSRNNKISQKRSNQGGGKMGKVSRKGGSDSRPRRGGKKGQNSRGNSERSRSSPGGGGNVEEANLSHAAGQMMNRWMEEARTRYPEEFSQLIKEWGGIMEHFENVSMETSENEQFSTSEDSEEDGCGDSKDYNYDFGTGPSKDCAEKPSYTVVCTSTAGYEVRRYDRATWVSTSVNTSSYDFAGMVGFKKLFEYIQGKNDQGIKLAMTLPVRKRIWSDNGEIAPISLLRDENFVVSFLLPSKNADNPPGPLDDDEIFIQELSYYVYAFNFSGWAYGLNVYEKYFQYENILQENGEPFVRGDFRMQMYDSPWIPVDRHNELLIPVNEAEGPPTCQTITVLSPVYASCVYEGCPSQTVIKTISTRQGISVRLLQAGVFAVQSRPVCDNLTDIMDQQDFVPMPNSQSCTIDSYLSLNLPVFLKARRFRTEHSSGCHFYLEKQYFVPETFQESLPNSDMMFEGTLHTDRANPTLYFTMVIQDLGNRKPTKADIYEQYERMTRTLSDRGYCYHQDDLMFAYYKGEQVSDSFELYVPVDLQCSN